jgi:hypothetical protein
MPAAALSKAWACGRLLAGIVGSNPAAAVHVHLLGVMCVVSASGWSLAQTIPPTDCGVSEYDSKASIMKSPRPTRGYCAMTNK